MRSVRFPTSTPWRCSSDGHRTLFRASSVAAEDRATVAEVLAELDNLPLVIELAASRVSVLPPAQLLKRLGDRFRHVRETNPRRTPRQASLEGAIAWSWDLTGRCRAKARSRGQRRFVAGSLSRPPRPCSTCDDPIAMIQTLVEKSLLRREASVCAMRWTCGFATMRASALSPTNRTRRPRGGRGSMRTTSPSLPER